MECSVNLRRKFYLKSAVRSKHFKISDAAEVYLSKKDNKGDINVLILLLSYMELIWVLLIASEFEVFQVNIRISESFTKKMEGGP